MDNHSPPAPSPAPAPQDYQPQHHHQYQQQHQHYNSTSSPHRAHAHQPPPPEQSSAADQYEYNEKDAYVGRQPYHPGPHAAQRGSKGSSRSRAHDSVMSSQPLSPKPTSTSPPSPTASLHRTIPEILPPSPEPIAFPPRAYLDPEKAAAGSSLNNPRSPRVSNQDVTAAVYDSGEYREKGPEDKPVQLLLWLSGPCAILSLFIALWTILALFILALVQPFRLLSSRSTKSSQVTTFLAAPLNLQLHLIYSYATSTEYSSPMLIVVNLFSPFVAAGVAIAAWTAAFFWFFSAILGDPAGQDRRNDGKETILGVRNWWERWLSRALR
ncbi:hypothetical protein DM02DRAFT_638970 [Periconia macrospinosa]|uniref:Uncharacterized protein n=1 Tax=Periconia macrospinosa TaxID=97972 RepID=A0A2V1E9E0_9PLEO|nr:hypothetical protein DM02DRAFT_638970 [Periconia macrospinosa]